MNIAYAYDLLAVVFWCFASFVVVGLLCSLANALRNMRERRQRTWR